jgi:HrpA-like RNA helicase
VVSGINPEGMDLLDDPTERMDAAREALVAMGAIKKTPMSATPLGLALDRLPVELSMGKAICKAADTPLQCTVAVATLAAVSRVVSDGIALFEGDRDVQVSLALLRALFQLLKPCALCSHNPSML